MEGVIDWVKAHKYIALGVVVFIVGAWWLVTRNSGGSSAASSTSVDPTQAALYAQDSQQQATLMGQAAQISGQLQMTQIQADTQQHADTLAATVALANTDAKKASDALSANVSLAGLDVQRDLGEAGIAAQLQQSHDQFQATIFGISAQLEGLRSNNLTTMRIAEITAAEQVAIGNLNAQTTVAISNNAAQVAIGQTNANLQIGVAQAKAAEHQSDNSLFGQIAGSVAGVALALL